MSERIEVWQLALELLAGAVDQRVPSSPGAVQAAGMLLVGRKRMLSIHADRDQPLLDGVCDRWA